MATQLNNSVSKAFAILRLFMDGRTQIAAADVADETGLNAVTAHRFLKTLEAEGVLVQVSRGTYRLGLALAELGDMALGANTIGQIVQSELNAITAELGEASMATLFEGQMVVCVARAMPQRSLSVDIKVGHRLEAYCTAHGKLWLAHMSVREREAYLKSVTFKPMTSRTIVTVDELVAELDSVRERGHAINNGEREDGISAIAIPVLIRTGRMVVGLSIFGPSSRMNATVMAAALERLQRAADGLRPALYGLAKP